MNLGTFAFAQLLRVLPRTRITRAVGQLCDLRLPAPLSRAVVSAYVHTYGVDLDEAQPPRSWNGNGSGTYPDFDAFFTRPLRDEARPLGRGPLLCPADGRLDCVSEIRAGGLFEVKGKPYRTADLLGSRAEAERYLGGQLAVIYLSPRDYHRVHAPAAGALCEVRSYPGDLFPVNGVSEQYIPNFLVRNRRVAIVLDTERLGRVTVVMVAAMIVGRITVTGIAERDVPLGDHHLVPAPTLAAGDELGIFHLGSTAVLLLEPGAAGDPGARIERPLGPVRMGESLCASHGGRA